MQFGVSQRWQGRKEGKIAHIKKTNMVEITVMVILLVCHNSQGVLNNVPTQRTSLLVDMAPVQNFIAFHRFFNFQQAQKYLTHALTD